MTADLEKIVAHCLAVLATRRGRFVLMLTVAIGTFIMFLDKTSGSYRELQNVHDGSNFIISAPVTSGSQDGHNSNDKSTEDDGIDWSRFAYTVYITETEYLCNALMVFERLHSLGSKADRVLLYPAMMLWDPTSPDSGGSYDAELLIRARDHYNVKIQQIEVLYKETDEETWAYSYTKLLAFNQTQYDRVISLDTDMTVLKHMDDLLQLPPCSIAMPRAYWLLDDNPPKSILSSHVMVIQPSTQEFERILSAVDEAAPNEYDMEILNKLYLDTAVILPHRPYSMLSSEFRNKNHTRYLGSYLEKWDPLAIYDEARTVHFSDYPVPKPWMKLSKEDRETMEEMTPECIIKSNGEGDCAAKNIWRGLYDDFAVRKEVICAAKPRPPLQDVKPIIPWYSSGPIRKSSS